MKRTNFPIWSLSRLAAGLDRPHAAPGTERDALDEIPAFVVESNEALGAIRWFV